VCAIGQNKRFNGVGPQPGVRTAGSTARDVPTAFFQAFTATSRISARASWYRSSRSIADDSTSTRPKQCTTLLAAWHKVIVDRAPRGGARSVETFIIRQNQQLAVFRHGMDPDAKLMRDRALDHSVPSSRARSKSSFARPYIRRFTNLSFVFWLSVSPFDHWRRYALPPPSHGGFNVSGSCATRVPDRGLSLDRAATCRPAMFLFPRTHRSGCRLADTSSHQCANRLAQESRRCACRS
jgi:hypothetical protein